MRVTKRCLCQRRGVGTYWVVDGDARLVEVWQPGDERPRIVTEVLRWAVAEDTNDVEIPLDWLFMDLPL